MYLIYKEKASESGSVLIFAVIAFVVVTALALWINGNYRKVQEKQGYWANAEYAINMADLAIENRPVLLEMNAAGKLVAIESSEVIDNMSASVAKIKKQNLLHNPIKLYGCFIMAKDCTSIMTEARDGKASAAPAVACAQAKTNFKNKKKCASEEPFEFYYILKYENETRYYLAHYNVRSVKATPLPLVTATPTSVPSIPPTEPSISEEVSSEASGANSMH